MGSNNNKMVDTLTTNLKIVKAARIHRKVQKDKTIDNDFIHGLKEIINKLGLFLDRTRRFRDA
jgi:hypothetical protein